MRINTLIERKRPAKFPACLEPHRGRKVPRPVPPRHLANPWLILYYTHLPPVLGDRLTVGRVALDHLIGVRIPVSQPTQPQSPPVLSSPRKFGANASCRGVWPAPLYRDPGHRTALRTVSPHPLMAAAEPDPLRYSPIKS